MDLEDMEENLGWEVFEFSHYREVMGQARCFLGAKQYLRLTLFPDLTMLSIGLEGLETSLSQWLFSMTLIRSK